MRGWSLFVEVLAVIASLVAVLDYFGIKPSRAADGSKMSLSRGWKLAIMLALVAMSLGLSGYSAYRSRRPIVVERIVEKPVERIVERLIKPDCAKPTTNDKPKNHKQTVSPSVAKAVTPQQNCPNGICVGGDNNGANIVENYSGQPPKTLDLLPTQSIMITGKMKMFPRYAIRMFAPSANETTHAFADKLASALEGAKMQIYLGEPGTVYMNVGRLPPPGISIEYGDKTKAMADAVHDALVDNHVVDSVSRVLNDTDPNVLSIFIVPQN